MSKENPRIAVVLGGGGIKPFSAIPLFNFLNQNNIKVDLLAGCSGGSIMAALYACGFTPEVMMKELMPEVRRSLFKTNWKAILALAKLPFGRLDRTSALFKPGPIMSLARKLFGDQRIEDLDTGLIFQVTDFQTGEGFGMEKGDLATAIYASSAIFPFLPPIEVDGRWLVDGVFSSPMPVLLAARKCVDVIIVVDFLESLQPNPKGPLECMMHLSKMYSKTIMKHQMALSIDLSHVEIVYFKVKFDHYVNIWDTSAFPLILEAGEAVLDRMKNELLEIVTLPPH